MTTTPPDVPDWTRSTLAGATVLYSGPAPGTGSPVTVAGVPTWVRGIALIAPNETGETLSVTGGQTGISYGTVQLDGVTGSAIMSMYGVIDSSVTITQTRILSSGTLYVLALPDPVKVGVTNEPNGLLSVGNFTGISLATAPRGGNLSAFVGAPAGGASVQVIGVPPANHVYLLHSVVFGTAAAVPAGMYIEDAGFVVLAICRAESYYRLDGMICNNSINVSNPTAAVQQLYIKYDVVPTPQIT